MRHTARLRSVTRTFGEVVAVSELDLELEAGRIYGLLGPNGSGKTTTLSAMLGMIDVDAGSVELLGAPPNDDSRARVGFVPQHSALPDNYRVDSLLEFVARLRGFDRPDARARALGWIDRLELNGKAKISELSAGQQRKVQIALALFCEPELILMDEPLTWLDPEHQDQVVVALREAAARGATVLLSTHRLREAQTVVEHVVMLHEGRKVLDDPLDQALRDAFDGTWRIATDGDHGWIAGPEVASITSMGSDLHVQLCPEASLAPLLGRAATAGAQPRAIEALAPTLHDLYLTHVKRHDAGATR